MNPISERRRAAASPVPDIAGVCHVCGCTDLSACADGCSWIDSKRKTCSSCGFFAGMRRAEVVTFLLQAGLLEPYRGRRIGGVVRRRDLEVAIERFNAVSSTLDRAGYQIVRRPAAKPKRLSRRAKPAA